MGERNNSLIKMLKGTQEGNVTAYYDIPYAKNGGRYQKALPPDPITEVRDCTKPGVVFPQISNGIEYMLGTTEEEKNQSEDAFRLNVWTPDVNGKLPVVFWIPGGAWASGGGALSWYHGDKFAENENVVFVNMNYRIGAMGNLCLPEVAVPNLAVHDVLMALQWVNENIAAFGGDPDEITIGGQSAGAWYALCLMGTEKAEGLFKRALLCSIPGNMECYSEKKARKMADGFLKSCGLTRDTAQKLIDLPVEKILKAQGDKRFLAFVDDDIIHGKLIETAVRQSGGKVDVMAGTTATDITAFTHNTPLRKFPGYRRLVWIISNEVFVKPTNRLLDGISAAGSQYFFYKFHYRTHLYELGSPHCFDLPFVFGNYEAWKDAPMMQGITEDEFDNVSMQLQDNLGDFVNGRKAEDWSLYDDRYYCMCFNCSFDFKYPKNYLK